MNNLIRLGDHTTKVGSGQTPSGGYRSYSQTGIPLIRSQNVLMGAFSNEGLVYISQTIDDSMSGSRVLCGDVLLNITGASIGRVCGTALIAAICDMIQLPRILNS
jgi:type I restriction enzyme S subunit